MPRHTSNRMPFLSIQTGPLFFSASASALALTSIVSLFVALTGQVQNGEHIQSPNAGQCENVREKNTNSCMSPTQDCDKLNVAIKRLTASINRHSELLGEVKDTLNFSEIRQRLLDLEHASRHSNSDACTSKHTCPASKCLGTEEPISDVALAAMKKCINSRLIGSIRFPYNSTSLPTAEYYQLAEIAEKIQGSLNYTYAIGFPDSCVRNDKGRRLALLRAEVIAEELDKQLKRTSDAPNENRQKRPETRAIGSSDWAFAKTCNEDAGGRVNVFLVGHIPWPLCLLNQSIPLS